MVVGSREAVGIPDETRAATAGGTRSTPSPPTLSVREETGSGGFLRSEDIGQTPELVGGL